MLQDRVRGERIERTQAMRAKLAAKTLTPMTPNEIAAEIAAYRAEQRRAVCRG